jgi:hypothetical protein
LSGKKESHSLTENKKMQSTNSQKFATNQDIEIRSVFTACVKFEASGSVRFHPNDAHPAIPLDATKTAGIQHPKNFSSNSSQSLSDCHAPLISSKILFFRSFFKKLEMEKN